MAQPAPASDVPAAKPAAPRGPVMSLPRQVTFWAFAALLILAVVFYLWWGLSFGVWVDNGVYAVFITLFMFGLAGMWLVYPSPSPAQAP